MQIVRMKGTYKLIKVFEFADRRRDIISYLTNGERDKWLTHLMKIQIFDCDKGKIDHWKHEVYSLFNNISKMQSNNKFPSKQFIYETLWNHYGDRLFTFIDNAQDEEPNEKLKSQLNFTKIALNTKAYFEWIANLLSRQGRVTSQEVYDELWQLGID